MHGDGEMYSNASGERSNDMSGAPSASTVPATLEYRLATASDSSNKYKATVSIEEAGEMLSFGNSSRSASKPNDKRPGAVFAIDPDAYVPQV